MMISVFGLHVCVLCVGLGFVFNFGHVKIVPKSCRMAIEFVSVCCPSTCPHLNIPVLFCSTMNATALQAIALSLSSVAGPIAMAGRVLFGAATPTVTVPAPPGATTATATVPQPVVMLIVPPPAAPIDPLAPFSVGPTLSVLLDDMKDNEEGDNEDHKTDINEDDDNDDELEVEVDDDNGVLPPPPPLVLLVAPVPLILPAPIVVAIFASCASALDSSMSLSLP